jgi:hypothetical protein
MKCLRSFFLRLRGAHDPSLHALRRVSPHFLMNASLEYQCWDRSARSKHREAPSIAILSSRSHFCDTFVGERDILEPKGESNVLSDRWHRRFSRWA